MKKIVLLGILIIAFGLFFGLAKEAKAGTEHNLMGWAWSENIGWISFNSLNCDTDTNGYVDSGACGGDNTTTAVVNYGVNVDLSTGNFTGHAWIGEESPSGAGPIGWISFNRGETNIPPGPPYNGVETFIARLDLVTNEVSGWARDLSACQDDLWDSVNLRCTGTAAGNRAGGWDGWIKMRCNGAECTTSNYGVSVDPPGASPREFRGFAWGSDVVGWISFNCQDREAATGKTCLDANDPAFNPANNLADYKVFIVAPLNQAPSAINLSVTNPADYCGFPTPPITLHWTYSDTDDVPPGTDPQSAYQVQVDDSGPGFPSPEVNVCVYDSTKISNPIPGLCVAGSGGSTNYAPPLSFGTSYDWQVKVWDSSGTPSNSFAVGPSFTTSLRPPSVNFSCNGQDNCSTVSISAGEVVTLQDISTLYGGFISRLWTLPPEGTLEGGYTTADSPIAVKFTEGQNLPVTLQVTDSNGSCSTTENLNVSSPLPKWKEIAPTGWIEKLFASIFQFFKSIV